MTDTAAADIAAAERREALARERLTDTLHELQGRLKPKALARDAARAAADAGRSGANAAKRNPAPVAGAAAVGVLFLARKRIARLFRRNRKLTVPAQARSHETSPKDPSHD